MFQVDTLEAYNDFRNSVLPQQCHGWDMVILDQNLALDDGTIEHGTTLASDLKNVNYGGCILMHSANNTVRYLYWGPC